MPSALYRSLVHFTRQQHTAKWYDLIDAANSRRVMPAQQHIAHCNYLQQMRQACSTAGRQSIAAAALAHSCSMLCPGASALCRCQLDPIRRQRTTHCSVLATAVDSRSHSSYGAQQARACGPFLPSREPAHHIKISTSSPPNREVRQYGFHRAPAQSPLHGRQSQQGSGRGQPDAVQRIPKVHIPRQTAPPALVDADSHEEPQNGEQRAAPQMPCHAGCQHEHSWHISIEQEVQSVVALMDAKQVTAVNKRWFTHIQRRATKARFDAQMMCLYHCFPAACSGKWRRLAPLQRWLQGECRSVYAAAEGGRGCHRGQQAASIHSQAGPTHRDDVLADPSWQKQQHDLVSTAHAKWAAIQARSSSDSRQPGLAQLLVHRPAQQQSTAHRQGCQPSELSGSRGGRLQQTSFSANGGNQAAVLAGQHCNSGLASKSHVSRGEGAHPEQGGAQPKPAR